MESKHQSRYLDLPQRNRHREPRSLWDFARARSIGRKWWRSSAQFKSSYAWRAARILCLERAHYRCEWPGCEKKSPNLDVHHVEPLSVRPDLALDQSNLLALCAQHHAEKHGVRWIGDRWPSYQPYNERQFRLDFGDPLEELFPYGERQS